MKHRLDKFVHKRAEELGYIYPSEPYLLLQKFLTRGGLSELVTRTMRGKTTFSSQEFKDSITIIRHTDNTNLDKIKEFHTSENPILIKMKTLGKLK